jgi:23S rRNA-intervening sequence protein
MKDSRDLKVWGKAHQLVLSSYAATIGFPKQEMFGLCRKYGGRALRFHPTSQRDVAVEETASSTGF